MTSFLDRLLGRPEPRIAKAVTSTLPWSTGIPLSLLNRDPQEKTAAYLRAYKVGWFYKAGKKIADDVAALDWSVSDGDMEEGEDETTIARPALDLPFDGLSPVGQFQRLLERPNPTQTGRQLHRKTEVRLDFAGAAAWYLEGGTFGLPTAIYGISPSRMWPSLDKAGNLLGWVMDKDQPSGGVPFEKAEILWFTTGNAEDNDIWGTSVVEAVYSQVPLTDMTARHTANVLATGGRLAGMLWPKNRALDENEFQDAQRAWRNVASDPEAGKRLLIFPEPMEYAAGASTPAEIGIPELSALNRDEILTAFPIGPEMLGVPMPSGLNASGESRAELRRFYYEDTIHPRADLIEETVQVGLLSRYEAIEGRTLNFEIDEPNLDNAPGLIEKVGAFKGLVSIGFDPKESVAAVGLQHIKWVGLPDLLDPAKQAQAAAAAAQAQQQAAAQMPSGITVATGANAQGRDNARTGVAISKAAKAREVTDEAVAEGMRDLSAFLDAQKARISEKIRATLPQAKAARKADPDEWWDADAEDAALRDALEGLYVKVGRGGLQVVADQMQRTVANRQVRNILEDLIAYGGDRITDINAKTRDAIKAELTQGVRRGYSINQLIDGVPAEGFGGVQAALLDNGVAVFDAYRAEMIARTETMLSFNRSALTGYNEFGVKQVQAIDGDGDAECASRDGHTFDVEEALGIEDHPNGTLDWIPVLDKSVHFAKAMEQMVAALPQPIVNNHITLPAITNQLPEMTVTNEVQTPSVNVTNEVVTPTVNVHNDVQTPSVTVTNDVAVPSVNVEVASPDVHVTNEVVSPSVTVHNDVATPSVTVTNDVQTPEVHVTNEVVTPSVNVESPTINVNVPEQRLTKRRVIRDKNDRITGIEES